MRFFHCANASKAVKLPNGKRLAFDVYRFFGGAWLGIAATEDAETIGGLEELSRQPKTGITEITEEEYKSALKKKEPQPSLPRLVASPLLPPAQAALELVGGRVASLVEGDKAQAHAPISPATPPRVFENVDEVLKLGVVKPVAELAKAPSPKRDEGEPSARSKGPPSRRPKHRKEPTVKPEEDE